MFDDEDSHTNLVTMPLIHRFFAKCFGVIQSLFLIRLPYRLYNRVEDTAVVDPSKNVMIDSGIESSLDFKGFRSNLTRLSSE